MEKRQLEKLSHEQQELVNKIRIQFENMFSCIKRLEGLDKVISSSKDGEEETIMEYIQPSEFAFEDAIDSTFDDKELYPEEKLKRVRKVLAFFNLVSNY